jgi:hypothetical protein
LRDWKQQINATELIERLLRLRLSQLKLQWGRCIIKYNIKSKIGNNSQKITKYLCRVVKTDNQQVVFQLKWQSLRIIIFYS